MSLECVYSSAFAMVSLPSNFDLLYHLNFKYLHLECKWKGIMRVNKMDGQTDDPNPIPQNLSNLENKNLTAFQ